MQGEGRITFVRSDDVCMKELREHAIQRTHMGTAYAIIGEEKGVIEVLVAGMEDMFPVFCSPGVEVCEAGFPIVPIPTIDKSPILAMEIGIDDGDHVYVASLESFWIFSISRMKPLRGFYKWTGKPSVTQYSMDKVTIVQSGEDMTGIRVIVVLAGSSPSGPSVWPFHPTNPYTRPGLALSLSIIPGGSLVKFVTDTLFDSSPLSFHQPLSRPGVYFWTQTSNTSSTAYLNSVGGASDSQSLPYAIPPSLFLSPAFAEVTSLHSALVFLGRYNSSQTILELKLAYQPNTGPPISIAHVSSSHSASLGAPLLFSQPSRSSPFAYALLRSLNGSYAIASYNFSPLSSFHACPSSSSLLLSLSTPKTSSSTPLRDSLHTTPKRRLNPKPRLHSRASSLAPPLSSLHLAPNCTPSSCTFENAGDCPPDHCWVFGATAQFYCCLRPPV